MAGELSQAALLEKLLLLTGEEEATESVSPATALFSRGRTGDVRQFASECRADFVIEGNLRSRGEKTEAKVWLIDGSSGFFRSFARVSGSDAINRDARP